MQCEYDVVVQYNGDSTNVKKNKRPKPSVLASIANMVKHDVPAVVYKQLVSKVDPGTLITENQVRYQRRKERETHLVSNDELGSIFDMAKELDCYIQRIVTHPVLSVVMIMNDGLKDFDSYVSCVSYRHPIFKEQPAILLGTLLHDTKQEACHDEFVMILKKLCPQLQDK
ncbi:unnamed protein product, partial [Didymodactylos carnosus]